MKAEGKNAAPCIDVLDGCTRIILETDEDDPETLLEINADDVIVADGYRIRFKY